MCGDIYLYWTLDTSKLNKSSIQIHVHISVRVRAFYVLDMVVAVVAADVIDGEVVVVEIQVNEDNVNVHIMPNQPYFWVL